MAGQRRVVAACLVLLTATAVGSAYPQPLVVYYTTTPLIAVHDKEGKVHRLLYEEGEALDPLILKRYREKVRAGFSGEVFLVCDYGRDEFSLMFLSKDSKLREALLNSSNFNKKYILNK